MWKHALASRQFASRKAPPQGWSVHRRAGRFMVIEQAMGTSKGRAAGLACLRGFVEEMKASG
jgi:hypothetical protein